MIKTSIFGRSTFSACDPDLWSIGDRDVGKFSAKSTQPSIPEVGK